MDCNKRDYAFGRIFAIAHTLAYRLSKEGETSFSAKYLLKFNKKPISTLQEINIEFLTFEEDFTGEEAHLLDLFTELVANLDEEDYTDDPLASSYLHGYHIQRHELINLWIRI
jgi:CRISPR-associated protein (Cas_Csd1)